MDLPRGVPSSLRTLHSLRSDDIARQRQEAGGVAAHLSAEWTAIRQGRRNLMLAGSRSALDAALADMMPHFHQPVARFDPETEQSLPQPTEGTLILMEAAALTGEQQFTLLEWLDHSMQREHVQVISATSRDLFSLVDSGEFLAGLYYRLNILRLDLEEEG